ncbi:unnamed protein product, partial [Mesorhabditis spiculigera]
MGSCWSSIFQEELGSEDEYVYRGQPVPSTARTTEFEPSVSINRPEKFGENMRQRSRDSEGSSHRQGGSVQSLTGVGVATHQTFADTPAVDGYQDHCGGEVQDCGDCE